MSLTQGNDEDIFQEFPDDLGADDETSIQFDKRRRRFVKEYEDDLFDIEQCPETVGVQEEQQYLSGKLRQLSASHQESESTTQWNATNRIKTDNIVTSSQLFPKYLSHESKEFDRMIFGLRQQTGTSIYTEKLRAIAFLIDQLERIELEKRLYTTYLRSGQEFALLKQRITHNYLPMSFDKLQISMPTPINTIMDTETAQSLKGRYDKILQRTKADMMQIYIGAADIRANQCRFQFNNAMNKLKENESTHPSDRILTKVMFDVLIKRFNNISEHLVSLYKLKLRAIANL
ncbi:unnamed protein product [Rotaria sordida]|uniref:Uncharacterized protein n=1 Tax=Rotaria sordida TaxID=392033 RepID=A0A815GCK1_9BILA|nr:unnamed protein product [Rotaria sordida]